MSARQGVLRSVRRWWPQRAAGLPPGQRLLTEMPRFSDAPKRWAPAVPERPELLIRWGTQTVTIPVADLERRGRFEPVDRIVDFHCVTTWSVRSLEWRGVPIRDVLGDALGEVRPAPFARVIGADHAAARFVIDDLVADDVLLATHLGGEALTLRHGAPLRLVTPQQYGYKNVKHVVEIDFLDHEPDGAYGAKEHLRGRVALEERHGRLPNWLVRGPYRVAVPLTARWADRALAERPDGAPVRSRDDR